MQRFKKYLIWIVAILFIFTISGFFILPPIVKSVLTEKLSQALNRPVTIQEININPYRLSLNVKGFKIKERSGQDTFISFDELYINADTFSVFRNALILEEIKLVKPYCRIIRNPDATYNFSDLIKPDETKKEPEKKTFPFSLNNIRIEQGSLDFWDEPKHTHHTVRDLLIAIPFVSDMRNRIDQFTEPVISANINGNLYALHGKTKPFADSLETLFNIDIKDCNIPYYLAYVPIDLNFKIISGKLDIISTLSFAQSKDKKPSVKISGDITLKQLALDDKKGHPLFRLPSMGISMVSVDPLTPVLHFSKIALSSPEVAMHRDKRGELNLLSLLPKPVKKDEKKKTKKLDTKASIPVVLSVDELEIAEGKLTFKDDQPSRPISLMLNNLNLKAKNITTARNSKAEMNLSIRFDKKGQISAEGPFGIEPLSADLVLKINDIDIRTFQEYFTDRVKINVTSGRISAAGNVVLDDHGAKGVSVMYNGNFLLANFNSIDKLNANDFLKWKSLSFNSVRAGNNPLSVDIRKVALTDFYVRLIVNDDGTMNLQNILVDKESKDKETKELTKTKTPEKAPASDKGQAKVIKIGAITLQNGKITFTDRYIKPNYSANLSQIGGRVAGLSSIEERPAEVELRGKFENYMPLEITGKIHPLREDPFVDLKASFKDMDLSPVSPYSGKYIGYKIQKGKLSFDLKYLIVNKKLDSENKVFIDQLTLGDKVDSPQATKLPVSLAIALLKDRKGEISLDIPVTGRTDDPEFSIAPLVIKVIVNLITKAATAPFALLGSLFGGGEELSYAEFDYGRSQVNEPTLKKIQTLTKALHERPSLKLDIEGHADLQNDREGLKRYYIERKMKARKLNDMIAQKLPAVPVDEVKIETGEYKKYLTAVYMAEPFPKPRNVIGMKKTLPVTEMEKLLLTYAVVKDDDLKLLAAKRAQKVKDMILSSGQVSPERVFIVEPKTLAPEKKEKQKDSRVDFKLK